MESFHTYMYESKDYYLCYRVVADSPIQDLLLFNNLIKDGDGVVIGYKRVWDVSCQINNDIMVYSYKIQNSVGTLWTTTQHVIGCINISNKNLPVGYRQEFVYAPLLETDYPQNLTIAPVEGSLANQEHNYQIVALNPMQQTLACPAMSATGTGFNLSWTPVIGATHYIIYREGKAIKETGITTFTDTGIEESLGEYAGGLYSTPLGLPVSPIYSFLNAIGIHRIK